MNTGKNGILNPNTSILTLKNNSKNYQLISPRHKSLLVKKYNWDAYAAKILDY